MLSGVDDTAGFLAFARAAAASSYTVAARTMGQSPSAVSKAISRLEAKLGVRLFNRTTRSLTLTPEGEALFERCQKLLKDLEDIEATVASARGEPAGRLRLSLPLALGRLVIAPALARFRADYPKIELELQLTDHLSDPVQDQIDAAIRIGKLADTRLVARRLAPHHVAICAAPDYLARRGRPQKPEDLFAHDCVAFRFSSSGRLFRWPFQVDGKRIQLSPPPTVVADDGEALAALARAGAGVTAVASYIAAPLVQQGCLVPLLTEYTVEETSISVVYPESRRLNPAVRAFVNFTVDLIAPRPSWDTIVFGDRKPQGVSAKRRHTRP